MVANLFIFFSVILSVLGQYMMKKGMAAIGGISLGPAVLRACFTPYVFTGLALYGISALIWLVVLSRVDLSYAYPMLSLGYVLVVLISWQVLHEPVTPLRFAGVVLISLGVLLVARS